MLRSGKSPPQIEGLDLLVRASLPGGIGNDVFVRFVQDLPDHLGRDVEVLIALSLLRESSSMTLTAWRRAFNVGRSRLRKYSNG